MMNLNKTEIVIWHAVIIQSRLWFN